MNCQPYAQGTIAGFRENCISTLGRLCSASERETLLKQWGVQQADPTAASAIESQLEEAMVAIFDLETATQSLQESSSEREALLTRIHQLEDAAASAQARSSPVSARPASSHPVFGDLVHDFGYKKVYAATVSQLSGMDIWEHQRVFNQNRRNAHARESPCSPLCPRRLSLSLCRAAKIAKDKAAKMDASAMRLPGVITLYHDAQTGKTGVLDGQHRIGALKILSQDQAVWPEEQCVLVEVVPVNDTTETKATNEPSTRQHHACVARVPRPPYLPLALSLSLGSVHRDQQGRAVEACRHA